MNILELLKEPCDKTAKKELDVFNILKNKNYFEKPEDSRPSHKALQSTFLLSIKRSQKETHLQEYLSPLFVHIGNMHKKKKSILSWKQYLYLIRFPTHSY